MLNRIVDAMSENLLLLSVIVLALVVLAGCNGVLKRPAAPPQGCEDSLIYSTIPNPEAVDLVLVVSVFEVARHKPEWRPKIAESLDLLDEMLGQGNLSYVEFAGMVASRVKWINEHAGVELVVLSELLSQFDEEIPISACDRELLRRHIAKQRRYLAMLDPAA